MVFFLSALLSIPAQQFKLVLDSIVWAFKHTMRNVADIGMSQVFVGWLKILSVLCIGTLGFKPLMVIAIAKKVVAFVKVFATDTQCTNTILVWCRCLKHEAMSVMQFWWVYKVKWCALYKNKSKNVVLSSKACGSLNISCVGGEPSHWNEKSLISLSHIQAYLHLPSL